tara:strand:- start:1108 stop:1239 length:132 start_codon:yes stop_codon:yes gene_type:complete
VSEIIILSEGGCTLIPIELGSVQDENIIKNIIKRFKNISLSTV